MFCGYCGSKLLEENLFCNRCGAKSDGGAPPKMPMQSGAMPADIASSNKALRKFRRGPIIASACLILLAGVTFSLWHFDLFQADYCSEHSRVEHMERSERNFQAEQELRELDIQEEFCEYEDIVQSKEALLLEELAEPQQMLVHVESNEKSPEVVQELPESLPLEPIDMLFEAIAGTNDWVRLTMFWTGNTRTVFERERDSGLWTISSRDGSFRMADPMFSMQGDVFNIGFHTTSTVYHLYNDGTGRFDQELTWAFETDPHFSNNLFWGTSLTNNLQDLFSQHHLLTIRVFWDNNQFAYFYRGHDGRWMMRGRQGGLTGVSPSFSSTANGVIMSIGAQSYALNDGGSGSVGNENITWSFCFIG